MFTGLIEATGKVIRLEKRGSQARLVLEAPFASNRLRVGDSLCVNGCCLTVVGRQVMGRKLQLSFDLLAETLDRTNLGGLVPGSQVNLETSMAASAGLHGHFVTGHVEAVGIIRRWEQVADDWLLAVSLPKAIASYVVEKGSIAVDGISLTVARVRRGAFEVRIIPHTLEVTNLSQRQVGDRVNLEGDILAKYVESMLERRFGK